MDTRELADFLEAVRRGDRDLDWLLSESGPQGGALEFCRHGLWHYMLDADLRRSDEGYASMQEGELVRLIALLRDNSPGELLSKIHFLGGSRV